MGFYISTADNVDLKKAVAVTAIERLITDCVTYTKSYSPLFFSILRRRVPVVYKTLSVLDVIAVKDSASVVPIKVVSVLDVVPVADSVDVKNIAISVSDYVVYDSASATKIEVVSVSDFIMYDSAVPVRYAVLSVFDIVSLPDSASVVARKVVSASDFIMYDYGVPIVYKSLSVLDAVSVKDDASMVKKKVVSVSDYVVRDLTSYVKSYSPLFFLSLQVAIPVRYLILDVTDVLVVSDSASVGKSSVVSASDYIVYDYVPSMSPNDIRYRSLYANVGMRTISVLDRITPYESVRVMPRAVHAYDAVKVWENVNIVRL